MNTFMLVIIIVSRIWLFFEYLAIFFSTSSLLMYEYECFNLHEYIVYLFKNYYVLFKIYISLDNIIRIEIIVS